MQVADHQPSPGAPGCSRLLLHVGPNRFLRILPLIVTLGGTNAILLSSAGWGWKAIVLAALSLSAGVVWCLRKGQIGCSTLSLSGDGSARLGAPVGHDLRARLLDNAWTSRWFSVVALIEPDHGKHYYCVVCASENLVGDYRRLLKLLHMRSPSSESHKVHGK